ncbi:MAG: alpha-galactosidase [Bacteroidales bacterium]|nr:alpha-galactosidase [Bacteroidales bacterium]
MKKALLVLAVLFSAFAANAQQTITFPKEGEAGCDAFLARSFRKGVVPPFSFEYGGKPSKDFIKGWTFSSTKLTPERAGETLTKYAWKDPKTGLEVFCKVKRFSDYNAMEWVLGFSNKGSKNTPQITAVKVVDLACASAGKGDYTLYYADGSNASKHDFAQMTKVYEVGDNLEMAPAGGRSSNQAFPFFSVSTPTGGIVFAIGWTGTWIADIERPAADRFRVTSGMKFLDTYLLPGEEVRMPSIAMVPWRSDDRMDGNNKFRHFILAHHHPLDSRGEPIDYPVCTSFNYGDPAPCNEYTCMTSTYATALIERYAQFSLVPDVFWLDAGWYKEANKWQEDKNWCNTVGCWEVDDTRFPNGLGEVADAAHSVGAKFMLWFEPERVQCGSYWCRDHKEYLLNHIPGEPADYCEGDVSYNSHIVNLGNPEARRWMTDEIIKLIRDNRIDYYRQDYNLDPEGFFWANDEPGRRGICEIGYITGLYAFWDDLRAEFPDMLIDNCASGGRRLDLETTSRAAPLWRTDYNYGEPIGYQCHTYGLNQWLPVHGTGAGNCDPFTYRSSFSYCVTHNWKVTNAGFDIREMQKRLAEFYAVRPYFLEDFYPLTDCGEQIVENNIWVAYQLNRPSDGSGYIVAFRREDCPEANKAVMLKGLAPDATYVLENQDNGETAEYSGAELAAGLTLALDTPKTSLLIKYNRK